MMQQPFASPQEALEHFGIKGMKWGVRKERSIKPPLQGLIKDPIVLTTKNGDQFSLTPSKPNALHKGMARISKKYRESYKTAAMLDIKDKDGKRIGSGQMWLKGKDELYLNWIHVDDSARGKGYATAVLHAAEQKGRELGVKRMTLEVPGISPDARHIYEKVGFKVTHEAESTEGVWGGLTTMEKKLN